jgi:hypothetical protein
MAEPIPDQLRARREASYRLPPLRCGHSDPLSCLIGHRPRRARRNDQPATVLLLSQSLDVLRRAWQRAADDPADQDALHAIAIYLREVAR